MKPAQRLTRLEARLPRDDRSWHERLLSFRVAGRGRSGLAMLWLTRLTLAIDDQRATDAQRAQSRAHIHDGTIDAEDWRPSGSSHVSLQDQGELRSEVPSRMISWLTTSHSI